MHPLFIQSIGMFTPIGRNAPTSAGSFLCGLSFLKELPERSQEGHPIVGTATVLESRGSDRLLDLSALALAECSAGIESVETPVFLCLPQRALESTNEADLLNRLANKVSLVIHSGSSRLFPGDAPELVTALMAIETELRRRRFPWCYLGGVDSLLDPGVLVALESAGRLRIQTHDSGIIPGEGAAFLRIGLTPEKSSLAMVAGMGQGRESAILGAGAIPSGRALGGAARTALTSAGALPTDAILLAHACLNEEYFASEQVGAIVSAGLEGEVDSWTNTYSIGDTGSASGAITMAYLAFLLKKHRLRQSPIAEPETPRQGALVALTGPGAGRAAVFMRRLVP